MVGLAKASPSTFALKDNLKERMTKQLTSRASLILAQVRNHLELNGFDLEHIVDIALAQRIVTTGFVPELDEADAPIVPECFGQALDYIAD